MTNITFDPLWKKTLDLMEHTNESLFLTGKAGTGKTTLIKHFLATTAKNVLVLAPTWVAAVNIWWSTIHSFFGIHPGITIEEAKDGEYWMNQKKWAILRHADVIVIDEISMVRADLLDVIHEILCQVFDDTDPFWWKQMIFVWDLYQLPPIVRSTEQAYFSEIYGSPYFFAPECYEGLSPKTIELQHIYRQDEKQFTQVLNKIRIWLQSDDDIALLNTRVWAAISDQAITLVTTNADADCINQQRLQALDSDKCFADARVEGSVPKSMYMNELALTFKVWAQVMMLVNWSGYANGSIGTIKHWNDDAQEATIVLESWYPVQVTPHLWEIRKPSYDKKEKKIINESIWSFKQLPFKLARAITIHKSQWLTFDHLSLNLWQRVFANGQAYVWLSRVTSLHGLSLTRAIRQSDIRIDVRIRHFMWKQLMLQYRELFDQAIVEEEYVSLTYVKFDGESTQRTILPLEVWEMTYQWRTFPWVKWFCELRQQERIFHLGRMYEVEVVKIQDEW